MYLWPVIPQKKANTGLHNNNDVELLNKKEI
jgi:hypothetical protein